MRPHSFSAAILLFVTAFGGSALGQPQGNHQSGSHHPAPASPYAGLESRPVKALSEDHIADLRAGRGMGLALTAELNGYPGPVHVLENAVALALSDHQRVRVQALVTAMKAETVPLGTRVIAAETDLDSQFGERTATPASLGSAAAEIARLQGALRAAHLRYHLATVEILTAEQVQRYNELRGYAHLGQE